MQVAKRLEGVSEYYFSKKLREIDDMNKEGKNVINLGIGSPDLPPDPSVIQVLNAESQHPNRHGYQSYKGLPVFRTAIAEWYKKWYNVTVDATTEVLPLMGSKEGIMHICMTYLNEGDAALVPNPGYPTYASNVALTGAKAIPYELKEENHWYPNWAQIEQQDLTRVKLLFLNYPHMPTGTDATQKVFEEAIAFAKKYGILIVHDNPYSFILNEQPQSILSIKDAWEVAIELNSLSKSHNMAGWRLGMLLAKKERIDEVLRFKSNMDSGMFAGLQLAAVQALKLEASWHQSLNDIYRKRREKVYELLDLLNCTYSTAQVGLFVWANIPQNYTDGYQLADDILYKAHVFITPGGIFGTAGNEYIRISLCGSAERFDEAIARVKNNYLAENAI